VLDLCLLLGFRPIVAQLLMISPDVMENISSIRAFVMKISSKNAES
jgi:hypothetical protein